MKPIALPPGLTMSPDTAVRRTPSVDSPTALHKAAQQFESLFLQMVMKAGRSATSGGGILGRSNGEEIFTDLRDSQFAKISSERGGFGIAEMLERQWAERLTDGVPGTAQVNGMQGEQHG